MKNKIIPFIAGGILALTLMAGAGFALANNQTAESEMPAIAQVQPEEFGNTGIFAQVEGFGDADPMAHRGGGRGENPLADYISRDEMQATIAETLGMTVEELEAAHEDGSRLPEIAEAQGVEMADITAALQAQFDQAVQDALADGAITEEQAERLQNRPAPFFGKGQGRGHGGVGRELAETMQEYIDKDAIQAATASALGITVEELEAAHSAGTRLPELAQEQGVDVADVQAAQQAVFEDAVAEAVADGAITQEQADELLSRPFSTQCGRGHGRGGQHGGRPGFAPNAQPDADTVESSNA